ncbi:MAG: response regulator [Thermoanaerobacterales bacterium]|nr:response regulator [Thermoanaerobacterales bacterium]
MDLIRVLICDDNTDYRDYLARGMTGHPRLHVAYLATSGQDAIAKAQRGAPDVALVAQGLIDMSGLDAAQQISRASPGTVTLLVSDNPWQGLVQQALAMGVREVLDKRLPPAEIAGLIEKWVDTARKEVQERANALPERAPGRGPFAQSPHETVQARAVRQMVVAVTSGSKGGSGKTTISVNMACAAAALASFGKLSVALVDFNESGNAHIQLNLGDLEMLAPRSILSWAYLPDQPPREEIDDLLVIHRPSGLCVVPAVPTPERHPEVTETLVKKVIGILRQHFSLVICDVPPSVMDDATWATIEAADRVVVAMKPDAQDLQDIAHLQRIAAKLRCDNKLYAVLNRAGDPALIEPGDFEARFRVVGIPFIERLPYDPAVSQGVQRGIPYVLSNPAGEYTAAIKRIWNHFTPLFLEHGADIKGKKSLFGGLFRRVAAKEG